MNHMTDPDLILVLGGARSGKSSFAERLAAQLAAPRGDRVVYLATSETLDEEMAARVARHRAARPSTWTTVECPLAVPAAVREHAGTGVFLLDCVTFWVSNLLFAAAPSAAAGAREGFNYDDSLLPRRPGARGLRARAGRRRRSARRPRRDRRDPDRRVQRSRPQRGSRVPARAPLPRRAGARQPAPGRAAGQVYFLVAGHAARPQGTRSSIRSLRRSPHRDRPARPDHRGHRGRSTPTPCAPPRRARCSSPSRRRRSAGSRRCPSSSPASRARRCRASSTRSIAVMAADHGVTAEGVERLSRRGHAGHGPTTSPPAARRSTSSAATWAPA